MQDNRRDYSAHSACLLFLTGCLRLAVRLAHFMITLTLLRPESDIHKHQTNKQTIRKRGNSECIATSGSPMPRSSYRLYKLRRPCQVSSRSACPLPSYSIFTADTLRYAVTLNSDPVTSTFDLWPWTCTVDRLRHDQTLYDIWAKSNNPRRSYCS